VNAWVRSRPDEWPIAADPDWPGFKYAQPSQLTELVGLMQSTGYPEEAIRSFLGGNYRRIAEQVWCGPQNDKDAGSILPCRSSRQAESV
jgi:hypothetical protein